MLSRCCRSRVVRWPHCCHTPPQLLEARRRPRGGVHVLSSTSVSCCQAGLSAGQPRRHLITGSEPSARAVFKVKSGLF